MNYRDSANDDKASSTCLYTHTELGKIRKVRKVKTYRDQRRSLKACKSAFIRELIPLLNREQTILM